MTEIKQKRSGKVENTAGEQVDAQQPSGAQRRSLLRGLLAFLRLRRNKSVPEHHPGERLHGPFGEALSAQERMMLGNIAELHQARVDDVMIPRSEIEAIDIDTSLAQTLRLFEQSGHSRMPVFAETLDDPRGMIHIRDLLNYITRAAQGAQADTAPDLARVDLSRPVGKLDVIREVLFVPGSMPASQLLTRMQATRTQMALVIDEHGGTDGLASMEDIVELVVGDIEDEHDDEDVMIVRESEDSWLLDAGAELEDVAEAAGFDFVVGEHGEDVDTIGGLVVATLDRIPARGEIVEAVPGFHFQVLEADRRKIRRLRMRHVADNGNSDEA